MSCWCGHGPWHHWGPGYRYGRAYGYGPEYGYGPGMGPGLARGPRRRRSRIEDLEEYLGDLQEEMAAVRAELEEMKRRSGGE